MSKKKVITLVFILIGLQTYNQTSVNKSYLNRINNKIKNELDAKEISKQFSATCDFLDAAINSLNSFNSLIKKENYRSKIISFNNPTSSDMGFNLENEIQSALKPLLAKAKSVNINKFSQVVATLISGQSKTTSVKIVPGSVNPLFSTLMSLVGTLTIQQKKITREDLDSFILVTSKYFVQYEKLNQANIIFDQNIERINSKVKDLQFDVKEYMLDMITIINKSIQRSQLKNFNTEELFLKYMDKAKLENLFVQDDHPGQTPAFRYPADGIKTAKDIAYNLQKLFNEYQKIYGDNYQQIRSILRESKSLGKNINTRQVDASLKELEELYNDSKNSDMLSLRLNTLFERLKILAATEQSIEAEK